MKPLSVGVHACHRANVGPDTKLIIIGAVPIGLLTILAAHAFGSPQIVIIDVDDCCLSFAKEMGADEIIKVSSIVQVLPSFFLFISSYSYHTLVIYFLLMDKYDIYLKQYSCCRMWRRKWCEYVMQWVVLWI